MALFMGLLFVMAVLEAAAESVTESNRRQTRRSPDLWPAPLKASREAAEPREPEAERAS